MPSAGRAHRSDLRQRCKSLGEGGGEGGPSAPNHLPPRRAGSTRSRTAPLEVDRSSSQSALSERSGRWNGRGWRGLASSRRSRLQALLQFNSTSSDRQLATPGQGTSLVSRHAVRARALRNFPPPHTSLSLSAMPLVVFPLGSGCPRPDCCVRLVLSELSGVAVRRCRSCQSCQAAAAVRRWAVAVRYCQVLSGGAVGVLSGSDTHQPHL